ncbi:protein FAM161B [Sphaeramia orbicularis]|uniref:protein FAM161B n=1 Tax=Sphaeramia orbicularis TaxID=375764 RepID=UPI00117D4BEB|nr:protein FAM161B [Sphaeramia orbicularis]XP_029981938.1 protein FAM161B [Sphaeramia orbicularis]
MSKLDMLLRDGIQSELILKEHLKTLSESLREQLQETEKRQREDLESRIHQNTLLSTNVDQELSVFKEPKKCVGLRKAASTSALNSDKGSSHYPRQSQRPDSSSHVRLSSTDWHHCTVKAPVRTQHCERAFLSITKPSKEEEAQAECQKKFCALPVPVHVSVPLYQEMMEQRDKERKQSHEQRKNFLLSMQKPFTFQEREKEKRENLITMLNQVSQEGKKAAAVRKPPHKIVKNSTDSGLEDQELCRKVNNQTKVPLKNTSASDSPKVRTADRTRKEKLGFLDEKPSFQPKIIHQVPDFSRLHKALQTEALRKTQSKEVTKCRPFNLRTSTLAARQSRMIPESSEVPKISNLSRSKSLGALTSLSTDTLPTYITDAVRKRSMAIRKSIEMRVNKNQESVDWLSKYQMRSQAMRKTVSLHAKLLDPHSSLKDVYNEKLQQHRDADQQRMREYMRDLRDMKARVNERPYLFEQVKQRNAKAQAEQMYRNKLKKAGLKEQFVEENGEADIEISTSSMSEEDRHVDGSIMENDIHNREENVDDGEKIEDVEEKSVKSKGEEMP